MASCERVRTTAAALAAVIRRLHVGQRGRLTSIMHTLTSPADVGVSLWPHVQASGRTRSDYAQGLIQWSQIYVATEHQNTTVLSCVRCLS